MVSFVKLDSSLTHKLALTIVKCSHHMSQLRTNLAAYEAVADLQVVQAPLPRDLAIITRILRHNPFGPGPHLQQMEYLLLVWKNYDTFMAAFNREQEVAGEIATLESEIDADRLKAKVRLTFTKSLLRTLAQVKSVDDGGTTVCILASVCL